LDRARDQFFNRRLFLANADFQIKAANAKGNPSGMQTKRIPKPIRRSKLAHLEIGARFDERTATSRRTSRQWWRDLDSRGACRPVQMRPDKLPEENTSVVYG
jgi:hypothetical protein